MNVRSEQKDKSLKYHCVEVDDCSIINGHGTWWRLFNVICVYEKYSFPTWYDIVDRNNSCHNLWKVT